MRRNGKNISKKMEITELERIKAGAGTVIIASDGTEKLRKAILICQEISEMQKNMVFKRG
jgi:hypothetical protein